MSPIELSAESPDVQLLVQFEWKHDRFGHRLLLKRLDRTVPLLTSLEGATADWWPSSPPLQQVTPTSSPPNCLLGVGMSGKSHWSISIAAMREPLRLVWDVACRATEQPLKLGSHYKIECQYAEQADSIVLFPAPNMALQLATSDRQTSIEVASARLSIVPISESIVPPATIRWCYHAGVLDPQ